MSQEKPITDKPSTERRDRNRVDDYQRSGHGSAQALSRLQMLERKLNPAIFPEKTATLDELRDAADRCDHGKAS